MPSNRQFPRHVADHPEKDRDQEGTQICQPRRLVGGQQHVEHKGRPGASRRQTGRVAEGRATSTAAGRSIARREVAPVGRRVAIT